MYIVFAAAIKTGAIGYVPHLKNGFITLFYSIFVTNQLF